LNGIAFGFSTFGLLDFGFFEGEGEEGGGEAADTGIEGGEILEEETVIEFVTTGEILTGGILT
jgi:hypothetical protein